jgi:hypothetical protein
MFLMLFKQRFIKTEPDEQRQNLKEMRKFSQLKDLSLWIEWNHQMFIMLKDKQIKLKLLLGETIMLSKENSVIFIIKIFIWENGCSKIMEKYIRNLRAIV